MLLGLQNATFEFGVRKLFDNVSWHINQGERIGLIGFNGTGKSTLIKILIGEYSLSSGTVEKSKETTIGYMHQDLMHISYDQSILQVVLSAFEKIRLLQTELVKLEQLISLEPENEKLAWQYAEILNELQSLDAYSIEYKAEEILTGLGFKTADFNRNFADFSGGWRMRVILAKMILQNPHILFLDEPTNHLDLPSIEWLEKYLQNYQGSVIIISHDKYFLNKMVNKIVEIYQQKLHFYSGNFDYFEQEKQVRLDLLKKAYMNQQDYIRQQERFIERFKAKASKATQAQSALKKLDKLELLEDVVIESPNLKIHFPVEITPGKLIISLKSITKDYPNQKILNLSDAEIFRGDKIALIGANGVGKSTVLRIIGDREKFEGQRVLGHNVALGFYAQHQIDSLNIENSVLTELQSCGSTKSDQELRNVLGCFLFSGDDIDKKIKVLSGGERARLALAKVMISAANFLLLDEPTNHLDMHSVEILIQALKQYKGTYIIVSHDRYFISQTATKIWEIKEQKIKEFPGNYSEYYEWIKTQEKMTIPSKKVNTEKKASITTPPPNFKSKSQDLDHESKQKKIIHLQHKIKTLEESIIKEEESLVNYENELTKPENYKDGNNYKKIEQKYKNQIDLINRLKTDHNNQFEKLIELENNS